MIRARKKKVAILGHVETYRGAPFDDESYDIWGINHHYLYLPDGLRFTAWFELHDPDHFKASPGRRRTWLRQTHDFPVYTQRAVAEEYGTEVFPHDEIEKAFARGRYQAITFSWLMALAILWEYDEVEFHGIHSLVQGEPLSGRPCMEYWIGYAEALGIKVRIPSESDCLYNIELRGGQYAYDQPEDGLGVTYMGGDVLWRKHPDIPYGEIGTTRDFGYLKFPLVRLREDE